MATAKKRRMKAPSKVPQKSSPKRSNSTPWGKVVAKVLLLLIWVVAAVISSQLVVGYAMYWLLGPESLAKPVPTAICSTLSYVLALVWVIYATPKISIKLKVTNGYKDGKHHINGRIAPKVMSREDMGLRDFPTWTDIGLAPVGFIVGTLLAAGLVAVFSAFPWFDASQAQDVGFSLYLTGPERAVAFVTLVVVAPVAEEVIFRGWLYGKLRSLLSSKISDVASMLISIFLVSLVFGIVHMQWNVGVNVFALSVVLCGLREITGTIYAGILTHMLKNGIAFYLLYVR